MEESTTTLSDIMLFLTNFRNEVNSRFEDNEARLNLLENHSDNLQGEQSQQNLFTPFYGNRTRERRNADFTNAVRRDSLNENIRRGVENPLPLQVIRQQPKFDHIKIEKMRALDIINFFKDIANYERSNQTPIPAVSLISQRQRSKIMEINGIDNENSFLDLSNRELYVALQKTVRPNDKFSFANTIKACANFSWSRTIAPTYSNMFEFLCEFNIYIKNFQDLIEFLSLDNAEAVPRINMEKPYGMIYLFCEPIPFEFGYKLVSEMDNKKFDSFANFKDAFIIVLQKYREVSKAVKVLKPFIPEKLGSKLTSTIQNLEIINDVEDDFLKTIYPESN